MTIPLIASVRVMRYGHVIFDTLAVLHGAFHVTLEIQPLGDLRLGNLTARLSRNQADIEAAQKLRYDIFYREMSASPTAEMQRIGRDFDNLDEHADHLMVLDTNLGDGPEAIVGTYRLIRRHAAAKNGRFYTADEYQIEKLVDYPGEVLELGRSCVHANYRNRPTMQLLWRGLAAYMFHYDVEVMFGCASFHGTDPAEHAEALSYLYYHHLAPPALRPIAVPDRYIDMRLMDQDKIEPRKALNNLPPLIKAYLRVGSFVGEGAVIDHQFNTVDVCIVVKTDWLTDKHLNFYERKLKDSGGFSE